MKLFSWSKTYRTHLSIGEIDAVLRKNSTFLNVQTHREEPSEKAHVMIQPEKEGFIGRYSFVPEISLPCILQNAFILAVWSPYAMK